MHASFVLACMLLGCTETKPVVAQRCTLRVAATGLFVDGDPETRDQAIAACKRGREAVVIVEDDAPANAWTELRARLERERITIIERGTLSDNPCVGNPLAKGCN